MQRSILSQTLVASHIADYLARGNAISYLPPAAHGVCIPLHVPATSMPSLASAIKLRLANEARGE